MLIRICDYFRVTTDYMLRLEEKTYIEISGLTDYELAHITAIIDDIRKQK